MCDFGQQHSHAHTTHGFLVDAVSGAVTTFRSGYSNAGCQDADRRV